MNGVDLLSCGSDFSQNHFLFLGMANVTELINIKFAFSGANGEI